jgi:transposase InsO family protein
MAYTINPKMPKVRRDTVRLVKYRGWSIRKVAKYSGYAPSTISRWCKKDPTGGWHEIPTLSSRPKTSPKALSREIVNAIVKQRIKNRRCGQVVHQELSRDGVKVSLSSVQRTLDRCYLLKKKSLWKRPHDFTPRPEATHLGSLLQCDTIHIVAPGGSRIYVYTLIDLYSRWAYAEVVEKIGAETSVQFIKKAKRKASFCFEMIQTDNGSEFSTWFTHGLSRLGIRHRHGRVHQSNDQAHVERFNRTVQEECLDRVVHTILSFRKALPEYLNYYNNERLHMGINYQTPLEVLQRC